MRRSSLPLAAMAAVLVMLVSAVAPLHGANVLDQLKTRFNQDTGVLRLVVLVDRMYDRDIALVASGLPVDQVFTPEMLAGGYRKKYFRAISRLVALARDGQPMVG